jgi:hypothetical protein
MRVVARGYRVNEVGLVMEQLARDAKIKVTVQSNPSERPVIAVSAGCHVLGALQPHVDPSDTETVKAGLAKRLGRTLPKPSRQLLRGLKRFVKKFVKRHLIPLDADTDVSVEHWLEGTNYTVARKKELLDKFNAIEDPFDKKHLKVKSFVKDEFYPEFKHCRWINSRTDEFKTMVGPIFQAISDEVFKMPYFIKKIPLDKRPKYILEFLGIEEGDFAETDYTAYEASFIKELMEAAEFPLYRYMVKNLSEGEDFMRHVQSLAGRNHIVNKLVQCFIDARRMSGEMNTSLGNGWTNLMVYLYVSKLSGIDPESVRIVVEGDDGLSRIDGNLDQSLFSKLGLTVKLVKHKSISEASFCGIVFSPIALANLTDPSDVVSTIGWLSMQYKDAKGTTLNAILRCKALSLLYQYRGCPVIQDCCIWILQHTANADLRKRFGWKLNMWERDILEAAIRWWGTGANSHIKIHDDSRRIVESKYGFDIARQHEAEGWFKNAPFGPIPRELIVPHPDWMQYYDRYVKRDYTDRYPSSFF